METFKVTADDQPVLASDGSDIFTSTSTVQTISSHLFQSPVASQYIKILPQTWHGHVAMAADVILAGSCAN